MYARLKTLLLIGLAHYQAAYGLIHSEPGSSPRVLWGHTKEIWSVALTPDGTRALTGSRDKTARLWELIP